MVCLGSERVVPEAIVFGGSGQIGRPLLARLVAAGWRVTAASRHAQDEAAGVRWVRGGFGQPLALPAEVDAIVSCGPLDAFAHWLATSRIACVRVVAFGSTSVGVKADSSDAAERDVAERLRQAEAELFALCSARDIGATVLRPTLVYGAGRDATLSRIAAIARRCGAFPLPRGADGLRQPVHVGDLADAAFACLRHPATAGRAYALPGGETLAYAEMVRRVLDALDPPARLLELPAPLFALAIRALQATGRLQGLTAAAVRRMREDLVFDPSPAQRDFGYAPRPFRPDAAMLGASGT